ncbi:Uncharacterised protein [Mycolicibacterium fortuitum]|uniref:Uncharacterized protein n=1 Tax=Mycolicibacterium fortuitum TaxID=1766 RepID=A0A378U4S2_MYCFO|nr:Uncharacterised protein [Mycolicibacterium fortuitum]
MNTLDQAGEAGSRGKIDEDDHDLLTSEKQVSVCASKSPRPQRSSRNPADGSPTDVEKASARLGALRAAAKRNSAQPINDDNFEKFFG